MILSPNLTSSIEHAVGSSSAAFSAGMVTGQLYMFVANVASWITQAATPVATSGSGSMYVPANTIIVIDGADGADLAVIEDSTAGKASLTPTKRY